MADLKAKDFTGPVQGLIDAAKAGGLHKRVYSDLVNDNGNLQFVDLVMGGGGVLGIALVGYTYALEELGIRFLSIGGTSAGSINALALAAFGKTGEPRSARMLPELANLPLWDFVDGSHAAKSLIRDFLKGRPGFVKALHLFRELPEMKAHLGLNPGDAFQKWLSRLLADNDAGTTEALLKKLEIPAGLLRNRIDENDLAGIDATLGLVATDITTETKAVFPRMAHLYWKDWKNVDPALYARASMSIPVFYSPMRVADVPQDKAAWDAAFHADHFQGVENFPPPEVAFVDGGVMSNFPIDMFHNATRIPRAPTFGVKLGGRDPLVPHITEPLEYLKAVFNAARHAADNDFIVHNPDFVQLVTTVKTANIDWLDFDMSDDTKKELFGIGVKAGIDFLGSFDWQKYKGIRAEIADANNKAINAKGFTPRK